MPVTSIKRDQSNNVCIVRMTADNTISEILTPNYIANEQANINTLNSGEFRWFETDTLLISATDQNGFFNFTDTTFSSLELNAESTITTSKYAVYVAPDGNDILGNGSITDPFQTVSKAMSYITTATSSDPFNIVLTGGNISDTNISLKPNINIIGNNSIVSVSGNVTIDPTWDNGAAVANYSNFIFDCPNPITLDFDLSATLRAHKITFDNFDVINSNQLIINGKGSEGIIFQNSVEIFSGALNLDLQIINSPFIISNVGLANLSTTLNPGTVPSTNSFIESIFTPTIFITCNDPTASMVVVGISGFEGNVSVAGTGALFFYDTSFDNVSTSLGGVAIPLATTDEMRSTHTPVNYTPSPNDNILTSHIAGIDNALGSAFSTNSNSVYVTVSGNNLTGNGSIEKPYQTIAFAISSITTASSSNTFNVVLLDGIYSETIQISLKPWVNLVGQSRNTIINNSLPIIVDSSWNSATNGTIAIDNLRIENNLEFDFTTVPTADTPVVLLNNISVGNNLFIDANVGNPNIFFIQSSFIFSADFNNAVIQSRNNFYFTGFVSGSTPFTGSISYKSIGDYHQSSVSLTGATVGPTQQTFEIRSCVLNNTLSLTGTQATLDIDVSSYVQPILTGSPNLVLTSVSGGLSASDFSPTNYTPTSTPPTLSSSLLGHLTGIDNKLAGFNAVINSWTEVTGTSQAASVRSGYTTNNAGLVTVTLPATAAVGDIVAVQGKGAGGWSLVANTGQTIHVGNATSSVSGSFSSTNQWDAIELICVTANTTWTARSFIGILTPA